MKVAVFHNFLDNIGGAEMIALTLARELSADVYTTNIDAEKIKLMGFADVLPRIASIGKVPIKAPFKQQLALLKFRLLNLTGKYDCFIVSGDWAVSGVCRNKPNLWYAFSPIREVWDLRTYIKETLVPFWQRPLFVLWTGYNRWLTKSYAKKADAIVAISKTTQARIHRYFNRQSAVIYPPLDTKKFYSKPGRGFWLSQNRLIASKRVDMQLEAFAKLPNERLIIIGSYEKVSHFQKYAEYCSKIKPANVEIRSWISESELLELYAACTGVISTAKEEDFGLSAVEAAASGKLFIAPNEGGYKETVIPGKTGILIDDINPEKLTRAIQEVSEVLRQNPDFHATACKEQAKQFDTETFVRKIKEAIQWKP